MKLINEQRSNSLIITDSCGDDECHLFAEKFRQLTGIDHLKVDEDDDCLHLKYRFKGTRLTLYYSIYTGLTVNADPEDAEHVIITDSETMEPFDLEEGEEDI